MLRNLRNLLERLENAIDVEKQQWIRVLHRKTLDWEEIDRPPLRLSYPFAAVDELSLYGAEEICDNPEKMLFNELLYAFDTSILLHNDIDDDLPYTVRGNFGTVIMASLFGGEIRQIGGNPPWVEKLGGFDDFRRVLAVDAADFSKGLCPKVIESYQFFHHAFESFPAVMSAVSIVLPDLQGPFDTAEMLRGSEIFVDLYDEPETVCAAMDRIAEAQIRFAERLGRYLTNTSTGYSFQHAVMIKGNILLRDDSSIMLSPDIYRERVAPHDARVLAGMNGGGIHACGRMSHLIDEYLALSSIKCIDIGQSVMNDIDAIYRKATSAKTALCRIAVTKEELLDGSAKRRFPTGAILTHACTNVAEAASIMKAYREL